MCPERTHMPPNTAMHPSGNSRLRRLLPAGDRRRWALVKLIVVLLSLVLVAHLAEGEIVRKWIDPSGENDGSDHRSGGSHMLVQQTPADGGQGAKSGDSASKNVERFVNRLADLVPNFWTTFGRDPEVAQGFYRFGIAACVAPWKELTPEEFGRQGEPFFPRDLGAAIARAARETICTDAK
jgi:hypothetical protein